MARTFGGVSTDSVVTGLTAHAVQRSYSMWFYRTDDGGGSLGRMFEKRTGADAQVEQINNNNPTLDYSRGWTTGGTWSIAYPSAFVWHHLLVVYDAGSTANDAVMYLDGISQTVTRTTAPTGSALTNTSAYVIGNRTNDNARNWGGALCEFAVWNSLLSADNAQDLARGVDAGLIGSPVGYWPLRGDNPEIDMVGGTGSATVTGTVVSKGPDWLFPGPKQLDYKHVVYAARNR